MREEQQKQVINENNAQPDAQLVSTVAAAVVQTLQTMENEGRGNGDKAQKNGQPKTIDLIGLLFFVLEKFWIVVLLAVLFAGGGAMHARNSVPTYTATAKLFIVNSTSTTISISDLQLGKALTMDYQEVFKTWEVHEMVREELNLPYSYEVMQSFIHVSNPEDTRLLYISATYPDAQTAADIANAYAKAAKTFIINTMRGEEPSDFSIALVPGTAHVVSKTGAVVKGFLLGSVLAIGILTLLFVFDDRPRTPEDISNFGGIPTLAVLPSAKEMRKYARRENKKTGGKKQNGND